ncbi:uncharacterized protein A4U43_C01F24070 [Asparagus officinalis]|uniref:cytokinin dehydrogenase n=1 Tax=Asparagus officinalis TaxID=4686 RepID=A0A5P1FSK1_ASPOF|nr:uncharacterized protein A4U43_C01F24070 [Asparagus officinalis]
MATTSSSLLQSLLFSLIIHISLSTRLPILTDPTTISTFSTDFGHLVTSSPAADPPHPLPSDQSPPSSSPPFHSAYRIPRVRVTVVVNRIRVFDDYVDVGGEQLWIDVLLETVKHGLSPCSWTDYLYLTVGGTLSNAGISGQAFRHGPQISNVRELDVVTGTGDILTCSKKNNSDLFYAVLGGLGQFGIITRARITLRPAPKRARWVRLIYVDFENFIKDQEKLISILEEDDFGFDYVEGSLMMDQSLSSNWRSSFFSMEDVNKISELGAKFGAIYCLEGSVYYDDGLGTAATTWIDQGLEFLYQDLNFVPGFAFTNDVSYTSFLNRVYHGELKLRSMNLWDVPHPWLNLFVAKSKIFEFNQGVFKEILKYNNSTGPILIYPMNKNKWDERMSAVIPDEEIFYSIGLLRSATIDNWKSLENQNEEILRFCEQGGINFKQYLPHYGHVDDWKKHFGSKWDMFVSMKRKYDPKALLSRGQLIFTSPLAQLSQE